MPLKPKDRPKPKDQRSKTYKPKDRTLVTSSCPLPPPLPRWPLAPPQRCALSSPPAWAPPPASPLPSSGSTGRRWTLWGTPTPASSAPWCDVMPAAPVHVPTPAPAAGSLPSAHAGPLPQPATHPQQPAPLAGSSTLLPPNPTLLQLVSNSPEDHSGARDIVTILQASGRAATFELHATGVLWGVGLLLALLPSLPLTPHPPSPLHRHPPSLCTDCQRELVAPA